MNKKWKTQLYASTK